MLEKKPQKINAAVFSARKKLLTFRAVYSYLLKSSNRRHALFTYFLQNFCSRKTFEFLTKTFSLVTKSVKYPSDTEIKKMLENYFSENPRIRKKRIEGFPNLLKTLSNDIMSGHQKVVMLSQSAEDFTDMSVQEASEKAAKIRHDLRGVIGHIFSDLSYVNSIYIREYDIKAKKFYELQEEAKKTR